MVDEELGNTLAFSAVQSSHWGSEQIKLKFVDNPTGLCTKCGQYPSSRTEPFLCLKLTIPSSDTSVYLSSILGNHFSKSRDIFRMKCSNCCPHEKEKYLAHNLDSAAEMQLITIS